MAALWTRRHCELQCPAAWITLRAAHRDADLAHGALVVTLTTSGKFTITITINVALGNGHVKAIIELMTHSRG